MIIYSNEKIKMPQEEPLEEQNLKPFDPEATQPIKIIAKEITFLEKDAIKKVSVEFVVPDLSPKELQFKGWIETSGRVGYIPETKSIVAFNPNKDEVENPTVYIGMDHLNILMGNDPKGEPLIGLAVAGATVEFICPEEEKAKWQQILERKVSAAKGVKKTLNLSHALDGTVRGLMDNSLAKLDNGHTITASDLLGILKSEQTKTDLVAAGNKLTEKAGDGTDAFLKGSVDLIALIPDNLLGNAFKRLPTPIPGISIGTAAEVIRALNNLNQLRHQGKNTESGIDPLIEITKILGVVIPKLNSERATKLLSLVYKSKK